MESRERQNLVALLVVVTLACGLAWAGSHGTVRVAGLPLFALCGVVAFAINWLAFVPSWTAQTERYYDLTGSLTYLTLTLLALSLGAGGARAGLIGGLVIVWAGRLGSFLFKRISEDGSDGRFDKIKPDFLRLLLTWTLQALWVFLTLSCGLAAMTAPEARGLDGFAAIGTALWGIGFAIEVIADRQKRRFKKAPENEGRFITTGLWAWSRHPNYFGEILLWVGIAVIAFPTLSGGRFMTLVSPVFVYVLLTRISGVPLLERRGQERWGDDPAYRAYVDRTPELIPRPPRPA